MDKQIYYHFLRYEDAKDDLKNERIKVSTIDTLNDPHEFMPYRRYRDREKRKLYDKVFKAVSEKWGILCFSPTMNEQLLWAHYADKHKGIALGFEIPEGKLKKVKYDFTNIRTKFELSDDQSDNEQKFLDLAEIKCHEWGYEKEYRMLVPLNDFDPEKGFHIFPFGDNLKLREIVFGCRCKDPNEVKIILHYANKFSVDIIATRAEFEGYRINKDGTTTEKYRKLMQRSGKG
jgi:hypothetical protein